jgi:hypothetical protein
VVEPAKCCGDLAFVSVNETIAVAETDESAYETEIISKVYEVEEVKGDLFRRNILIQVRVPHGNQIFKTDIFNEELIEAKKESESGFDCSGRGACLRDYIVISTLPVEAGGQFSDKLNRYEISVYIDDNHEIEKLEMVKQESRAGTRALARELKPTAEKDCLDLFGSIYNYNTFLFSNSGEELDYRVFDTRGGDPALNGIYPQTLVVRNDLAEPQGFFYDLSFISVLPFEVEWKDRGFVIKAEREVSDFCENWHSLGEQRPPYDEVNFKVNFNKQTNNLEIEEEIMGSYRPCQ